LNSGQQDKRVTGKARHPPGAFLEPLSAQLASRYLATVFARWLKKLDSGFYAKPPN
jgi:hypothetical protein